MCGLCLCVCVEGVEVSSVKEWYQNRSDQLKEREANKVDKVTIERFGPGQRFHLLRKSASCCSPVKTTQNKLTQSSIKRVLFYPAFI